MRSDSRDGDRIIPAIPWLSCRRWRRSCSDASSRGKLFWRLHSDLFRPSHSDEFGVGGPPCVRCNHSRPRLRRKDLSWLLERHGSFGGFGEARLRLIEKDQISLTLYSRQKPQSSFRPVCQFFGGLCRMILSRAP